LQKVRRRVRFFLLPTIEHLTFAYASNPLGSAVVRGQHGGFISHEDVLVRSDFACSRLGVSFLATISIGPCSHRDRLYHIAQSSSGYANSRPRENKTRNFVSYNQISFNKLSRFRYGFNPTNAQGVPLLLSRRSRIVSAILG